MKNFLMLCLSVLLAMAAIGCESDARIAAKNLSKDAEMFRVARRIVFYNGITDQYILSVEGFCSVEFYTNKFTVTCKIGENEFVKHYLGRADNVFPFVEQLAGADVSTSRYKVIFNPLSIIPDVELAK